MLTMETSLYLTWYGKHGSGTWFKKEHEKVAGNLAGLYLWEDKQIICIVCCICGAPNVLNAACMLACMH